MAELGLEFKCTSVVLFESVMMTTWLPFTSILFDGEVVPLGKKHIQTKKKEKETKKTLKETKQNLMIATTLL